MEATKHRQIRIGVTDSLQSKPKFESYVRWIQAVDPTVETVTLSYKLKNEAELNGLDALLLTGGGDVHPRFYGMEQRMDETDGVNEERDEFELDLIDRALDAGLPILGVCRGMQVANVYLGGSLVLDLPSAGYEHHERDGEAARWHDLQVVRGSLLEEVCGTGQLNVNSYHHQAVGTLGNGLMASAVSPDGVIEAAEWMLKDRTPFLMLVQWHPERMIDPVHPASKNIAVRFLQEIKRSIVTKKETTTHHLK